MAKTPREQAIRGIVLRKVKYRETSLIMDIFTRDRGIIAVMAKGVRKEKNRYITILDLLNELEIIVYKKSQSDWYIFKSAELVKAHLFETNFTTNSFMTAASELCLQLEVTPEDSENLYNLMIRYLDYLRTVKSDQIAIFWRFLLRLMKIMGIGINLENCILCGNRIEYYQAFYPQKNGFVCRNCYRPALEPLVLTLDSSSSSLMSMIPEIGNHLGKLEVSSRNIEQINRILLTHLEHHFHKSFRLNSLKYLISNYRDFSPN